MDRQIEVLYSIFKLELSPPFELFSYDSDRDRPLVFNSQSKSIGIYKRKLNQLSLGHDKCNSIMSRIKQTFNVNKISDDDAYHIAKHLYNWLQHNFPEKVESVAVWPRFKSTPVRYIPSK